MRWQTNCSSNSLNIWNGFLQNARIVASPERSVEAAAGPPMWAVVLEGDVERLLRGELSDPSLFFASASAAVRARRKTAGPAVDDDDYDYGADDDFEPDKDADGDVLHVASRTSTSATTHLSVQISNPVESSRGASALFE